MKIITVSFFGLFLLILSGCGKGDNDYTISARQLALLTKPSDSYDYPSTTLVHSIRKPNIEVFEYFDSTLPIERVLSDPILRTHIVGSIIIPELGLAWQAPDTEIIEAIQTRKRVIWVSDKMDAFTITFKDFSPGASRILRDLHLISMRCLKAEKKIHRWLTSGYRQCGSSSP